MGNSPSTIADLHLDFDPAAPSTVSGVCPADTTSPVPSAAAQMMELAVQVTRRSGEAAGGPALDVTYEVGGNTRTTVIPFAVWLCAATCPPEASQLYHP